MDLKLSYIDERCKLEGNSSGLFLKAYDIHGDETKTGNVIKTKNVLGKTETTMKDSVTGVTSVITVDKRYKLDTLYRCIVDTGVEIPDMSNIIIDVQPLAVMAFKQGIIVASSVYPITKGDKRYIGIVILNTSTYPFFILQFDTIAKLRIMEKTNIVIC